MLQWALEFKTFGAVSNEKWKIVLDENAAGVGGVAEVDVAPKSADHEGIPGPITRLLVIANRGIANLIQDLILRLAQTSERIVNFKARLVTALI